jgi:hypothetical protein
MVPVESVAANNLRLAGALLLTGGIVFTIGAMSPPWEQWYAPLQRALQVIGQHKVGWYWIHACFVLGVILTILGFVALAHALRDTPSGVLASLVGAAYVTGAVFWLVNIAFRGSVQVWAADEVIRTGSIPIYYEPLRRWASLLFAGYSFLGYAAVAGLGWVMLRTGLSPRWAAWFAVVMGLSGGGVMGMSVPMIVHIPLMVIGALLLKR